MCACSCSTGSWDGDLATTIFDILRTIVSFALRLLTSCSWALFSVYLGKMLDASAEKLVNEVVLGTSMNPNGL